MRSKNDDEAYILSMPGRHNEMSAGESGIAEGGLRRELHHRILIGPNISQCDLS
jgi:hypothetical protein